MGDAAVAGGKRGTGVLSVSTAGCTVRRQPGLLVRTGRGAVILKCCSGRSALVIWRGFIALWKLGWGKKKKMKWTVRVSLDLVSHTKAPCREQVDCRTGPLPLSAVPWVLGPGEPALETWQDTKWRRCRGGERRTRRDREMAALPAGRESRQRGGARPGRLWAGWSRGGTRTCCWLWRAFSGELKA